METVESSSYKHKPDLIAKLFKQTGNTIIANDDLNIVFPERYIDKSLATLGSTVDVIAMVAIIDNQDNYGVMLMPITMTVTPNAIEDIMIDGKLYKSLLFDKGDVVVPNTIMVKNADFMYNLFDEFFVKGTVPWYISYDMLSDIFIESKKYANSGIGGDIVAFEILTATIARSAKDKHQQYRQTIKSTNDKSPVEYVGLNSVYYSYVNTGAKLIGNYYGVAVTGAIVDKEKESTELVDMLRS